MEDLLSEVAGEIEAFSAQIGLRIMHAVMGQEVSEKVGVATKEFENGKADFSDYLIGYLNKKRRCNTTITFDEKAAALFTLI